MFVSYFTSRKIFLLSWSPLVMRSVTELQVTLLKEGQLLMAMLMARVSLREMSQMLLPFSSC